MDRAEGRPGPLVRQSVAQSTRGVLCGADWVPIHLPQQEQDNARELQDSQVFVTIRLLA